MNKRKLLAAGSSLVLVAGLMAGAMSSVLAVHDAGVFQLDGNAQTSVQSNPTAVEDWDLICKANPSTCTFRASYTPPSGTTTATASSHIADGTNASIFTGGGSKDPQDLTNWRHKDGSVPDKDNLLHSFAARYSQTASATCPSTTSTCELLYFGSDRFDNSGDAQQGFWFFQNKVVLGANGRFTNAAGQPATHTNGDLLIVSDFSNGGAVSTINVYKWNNGALTFLAGGDNQKCAPDLPTDPFCGLVNATNGTIAPWTYTDKSGNGTYLQGELYEAGLNLSDPLINLGGECFSSFLSETRSSTSTTATLKDFVLGQFAVCGATMGTTPTGAGEIGANGQKTVSDSATIGVTGGATPPAPTGSVLFYLCGPSTTSISTCSAATGTLKATINLNTATVSGNNYTVNSGNQTVTSAGYYCWFSSWSGNANYPDGASHAGADECFQITPHQPTMHTNVSDAGPVVPGTAVHDTLTFDSAPATPSNGTFGTITFNAYGPIATNVADCNGTAVFSATVNVTASTTSYGSGDFSPTAPGFYFWTAAYAPGTGDVNNLGITATCGQDNESFQVQLFNPSLTTAQTVTIKDSATITVAGGGNLSGVAHFRPFSDGSCTVNNELAAQQDVAVAGPSGTTVETTPMTITAVSTTIYWQVSYTSNNGAQSGIAATCTENSSITINN